MDGSEISTDRPSTSNAAIKGLLLIGGSYIATIVVTVAIVVVTIMALLDTTSCSTMGTALVMLWGTIAVLFLASVVVVGIIARKIAANTIGRLLIVGVYGAMMLGSFLVIAFVLLVAFDC